MRRAHLLDGAVASLPPPPPLFSVSVWLGSWIPMPSQYTNMCHTHMHDHAYALHIGDPAQARNNDLGGRGRIVIPRRSHVCAMSFHVPCPFMCHVLSCAMSFHVRAADWSVCQFLRPSVRIHMYTHVAQYVLAQIRWDVASVCCDERALPIRWPTGQPMADRTADGRWARMPSDTCPYTFVETYFLPTPFGCDAIIEGRCTSQCKQSPSG